MIEKYFVYFEAEKKIVTITTTPVMDDSHGKRIGGLTYDNLTDGRRPDFRFLVHTLLEKNGVKSEGIEIHIPEHSVLPKESGDNSS